MIHNTVETRTQYTDGQDLRCKFAMAVRAGDRIYLRGQTGSTLDGDFVGYGDAAAQAGLVVDGFANPRIFVEIDVEAMVQE